MSSSLNIYIDVYCQGVQLIGDDKNLNDYEIDNEDNLLIVSKVKLPIETFLISSAGKLFYQYNLTTKLSFFIYFSFHE